MEQFHEIACSQLQENPFDLIGKQWMLITSGNEQSFNTMTASWGSLGVLWGKNVAHIYIRPQRYTYEFLEKNDYFTLSFFDETYRNVLAYCGKYSGRDCNKAKDCNLTPMPIDKTIAFQEARLIFVCKKLYHQDIKPELFHETELVDMNYPNKDYHRQYTAEIIKVLKK